MSELHIETKKLNAFIIGATAHLARIEKALGLPKLNKDDYMKYSYSGGNNSFTNEAMNVGVDIINGGGFFDWVNNNVVKRLKNVDYGKLRDDYVKPFLKNETVRETIQSLPYGNYIDTGLKLVGYGDQNGGAYRVEGNAYNIEGGAYRIEGGSMDQKRMTRDGQIYAPDRRAETWEEELEIGKEYDIQGRKYLFTDKGFVRLPMKGGAYRNSNGDVIVSNSASKGAIPSDFLQ